MPIKVVYIEDEPVLCELFREQFSNDDVEIFTFTDPQKFFENEKKINPDIIFVDYRLPGTNGDLIAKQVSSNVPIVLITGEINVKPSFPFKVILHKPYREQLVFSILRSVKANVNSIKKEPN